MSSAARHQHGVWLRYRNWAEVHSEREVDPYGLVFHYGRWYLVGFDRQSSEVRVFRIDRVLAVEAREEKFEPPAGFDAAEHLQTALANLPWGIEVEVLLKTSLAEARSSIPAHVVSLRETEAGVVLRTEVDDLKLAARYLVGWGYAFVVIGPEELREEVRRLASELPEAAEHQPALTASARRAHRTPEPS